MTLKEKFSLILMEFWSSDWESKCEQEANEFDSGFSEWLTINYPNQRKFLLKQGNLKGFYQTKELLEIYKKEKYETMDYRIRKNARL
jgi:hypothetical protein